MTNYQIKNDFRTGQPSCILRSDGTSIPFDTANTDYQAYLTWLENGGIPLPAENT